MGVMLDIDKISITGSLELSDQNNNIIGELRSACYSPHFKKVIGIAMMKKPHWNVDKDIKAKINGEICVGKVCDLPFIQYNNFKMKIAIVGATGNVGRKTLEVFDKKNFKFENLYLVASEKSAGKKVSFRDKEYVIENLETYDFSKADITFSQLEEKLLKNMQKKQPSIQL